MLAIIQEIGVIQSVIIAACFGFMLGMLVVIVGEIERHPSRIFSKKEMSHEEWFQKWPKHHKPT